MLKIKFSKIQMLPQPKMCFGFNKLQLGLIQVWIKPVVFIVLCILYLCNLNPQGSTGLHSD